MKSSTKGFILLIFLAAILIVSWHFLSPLLEKRKEDRTSDAGKITEEVKIAGDSWLGYFVLRSPEFKKMMRSKGINPLWIDDKANYVKRMKKFANGDYDFIVATVDSYLLNAHDVTPPFPGVIICVIDESKGGDAIIAQNTIVDLNALNSPGIKIALTPASPSEFLMEAVASHFNLDTILNGTSWKVETDGAKAAYKALKNGSVQAAVIWEPYVSKALTQPQFTKLLGTEKTKGLIVDILLVQRDVLDKHPDTVETLLRAYFRTLAHYRRDKSDIEKQAAQDTHEKKAIARKMLEGIKFVNFNENCRSWFGLNTVNNDSSEQLIMAIDSTVSILQDNNHLKKDPLDGNPYKIISSAPLETLQKTGALAVSNKFTVSGSISGSKSTKQHLDFPSLDETGWKNLKIVGKLKIRPIVFRASTPILSVAGKEEVDKAAEVISHYPQFRILIKGHTSPGGNESANKNLSQQRADTVRQYLISVHDIDPDRIHAVGIGSAQPLRRKSTESYRAYKLRLQRVELVFLEENI